MSKIASKPSTSTNVNASTEESKPMTTEKSKKVKDKISLASHQLALKLLEAALARASAEGDVGAVKLLTTYTKNVHYRLKPWAKVTVTYSDE